MAKKKKQQVLSAINRDFAVALDIKTIEPALFRKKLQEHRRFLKESVGVDEISDFYTAKEDVVRPDVGNDIMFVFVFLVSLFCDPGAMQIFYLDDPAIFDPEQEGGTFFLRAFCALIHLLTIFEEKSTITASTPALPHSSSLRTRPNPGISLPRVDAVIEGAPLQLFDVS